MDRFDKIDSNQDGELTREEWIAKYGNDSQFNLFDTNKDGIVDAEEFLRGQLKAEDSILT